MARKRQGGRGATSARSVSDSLRSFIALRDLSDNQLGKLAGVDPGLIGRFMRREREISGPTIDRLCSALGLDLVERSRGRGRPGSARNGTGPGPSSEAAPPSDLDRPGDVGRLASVREGPAVHQVDSGEG